MKKSYAVLPLFAGFFVMGFGDIIGTVMNQIKAECVADADTITWLMPVFAYVWFFLISIPTGVLAGRIGRKNTVLLSLAVTLAAMVVPMFANAERWYLYVAAFALIGIGNTVIQAALPALMSNMVAGDRLASRISFGQFVKAICAALTPVFVYLTASALGNWKLIFPLYGALTALVGVWLWISDIPDERAGKSSREGATSFASCFAMMKNPYVAAMTVGILFSVGADVGMSVAIPEYLQNVFNVDKDLAGAGPTVYFVAKTVAAFAGAILFAKVSAAVCLPWCMGLALVAILAVPFAPSSICFLALVALVALLSANSFGMCMGLAIERVPGKANEITSLMVMAIVGGGVVSAVLGLAQRAIGAVGLVLVLAVCLAYLFVLGLFAASKK